MSDDDPLRLTKRFLPMTLIRAVVSFGLVIGVLIVGFYEADQRVKALIWYGLKRLMLRG